MDQNQHQLMVVDIKRECFVTQPDSLLATLGITSPLKDFFMDKTKDIWVINDKDELIRVNKERIKAKTFLPHISSTGDGIDQLYDLGVVENQLYLFTVPVYWCAIILNHAQKYTGKITRRTSQGKVRKHFLRSPRQ